MIKVRKSTHVESVGNKYMRVANIVGLAISV